MSLRIVYLVTISQVWVASEDLMVFWVWAANWVGLQLRVYEKDECSNLVVLKDCRGHVKHSQPMLSYQGPGDGIEYQTHWLWSVHTLLSSAQGV